MNIFSSTYLHTFFKIKVKQILNIFPFFKSKRYTTFLIVGHPRTGTSLLHTYLNSHWNILSLNEPLINTSDISALFNARSKIIKAVGFKYFHEYTQDDSKVKMLIELLKRDDIKIIKIERKNYLRTYVSRCIAEKTNEWSSTNIKQHSINDKKVVLSKEQCIHAFAQYKKDEEDTNAIIKEFKTPVVEIDYETLVQQPDETMYTIQNFLDVSRQKPQSLLLQQNAEPLRMLIKNYDELKQSFEGTEFYIFFNG